MQDNAISGAIKPQSSPTLFNGRLVARQSGKAIYFRALLSHSSEKRTPDRWLGSGATGNKSSARGVWKTRIPETGNGSGNGNGNETGQQRLKILLESATDN